MDASRFRAERGVTLETLTWHRVLDLDALPSRGSRRAPTRPRPPSPAARVSGDDGHRKRSARALWGVCGKNARLLKLRPQSPNDESRAFVRWASQDSNLGPTDYESAALTN